MDEQSDDEVFRSLTTSSITVRGALLNSITEFEWVIDIFIAKYFCDADDSKFHDFMSLIIKPHVSFRNKVDTFKILADKLYPKFRIEHPTLDSDFGDIIFNRNIVAHDPLHGNKQAIDLFRNEHKLQFHKFKSFGNNTNRITQLHKVNEFTQQFVKDLIIMADAYTSAILDLIEK